MDNEMPTIQPVRLRESMGDWIKDKLIPPLIASAVAIGGVLLASGKFVGEHTTQDINDRVLIQSLNVKSEEFDARLRELEKLMAQQVIINEKLTLLIETKHTNR